MFHQKVPDNRDNQIVYFCADGTMVGVNNGVGAAGIKTNGNASVFLPVRPEIVLYFGSDTDIPSRKPVPSDVPAFQFFQSAADIPGLYSICIPTAFHRKCAADCIRRSFWQPGRPVPHDTEMVEADESASHMRWIFLLS